MSERWGGCGRITNRGEVFIGDFSRCYLLRAYANDTSKTKFCTKKIIIYCLVFIDFNYYFKDTPGGSMK